MKRLARLYSALDETTQANAKVAALADYLKTAAPEDAVWTLSFLMGRKPRQAVPAVRLRKWAAEEAGIPDWLFDASYDVVGDLAETIALLLPPGTAGGDRALHDWVEQELLTLRELPQEDQHQRVVSAWRELDRVQRFVWNKLITGGFRVGVSQSLVTRALARFSGLPEAVLAHRLMGRWAPEPSFYSRLFSPETDDADLSRPYPFFLAYPLEGAPDELGPVADWQAEWKWDGIRAQVIRRGGQTFIWSRGEELITARFPEITAAAEALPDGTVVDGEILAWKDGRPLDFAALQQRIGRKLLDPRVLHAAPVVLMAYDLLEWNGRDIRGQELAWRVSQLDAALLPLKDARLRSSPKLRGMSWRGLLESKEDARRRGTEGLMLKRRTSPYRIGRRRGDWWKWKVDPLSIDAVLTYAQRGHGRRSGLFTDYTFSVWDGDRLVPFAKAYSGLTDDEIREVDRFIRDHTLERFGPVRAVKPELVFEIAFEDIRRSPRHRSGVAVRFPRIARRRTDKTVADADTLQTIRDLLPPSTGCSSSSKANCFNPSGVDLRPLSK
jgi:DNA ligase-1